MAIYGMVDTYQLKDVNKIELEPQFRALELPNTPLLNKIGFGANINSTRLEWYDDIPLPLKYKLAASHTAGDGKLKIGDNAVLLKVGNILKAGNVVYRVVGVNAGETPKSVSVTVVSGTDADLSVNAEVELISDAMPEGSDPAKSGFLVAVKRYNITQIFTDAIEFTDTQLAVNLEYQADIKAQKTMEKMKKLRLLLERTIVNGKLYEPANNSEPRMMSGFLQFVSNNGLTYSGTFTEDNFKAWLKGMFYLRQQEPISEVWMNPATKQAIFNPLLSDKVITTVSETTAGKRIDRYVTEWGEVTLNTSAVIPEGMIVIADFDKMAVRPLRPLALYEVAKTGDKTTYFMVGEYTLEVRDSALMGYYVIA